jgi:hypothetical protein
MRDPWRVVDPLRAVPISRPTGKIDLADKDLDADLRPSRACTLRFRSCVFEIVGSDLHRPEDALARLVRCVTELKGASAKFPRTQHLLETIHPQAIPGEPAATLSCGPHVLSFAGMTLDQGTLVLARALMAAGRDTKLAPILRSNGVTPMMRTT